jgi:Protein of unknown function (DUF2786)
MSEATDSILRKIRKCLALSASSNEHEAAAALRQAQKLMAEYGVNEATLAGADVGTADAESQRCTQPAGWEHMLAHMIASVFGCQLIFRPGYFVEHARSLSKRGCFVYIGLKTHVELAVYAHSVLRRQIEKGRGAYLEQYGWRYTTRGEKIAAGTAYCEGYIASVRSKVSALVVEPLHQQAIESKKRELLGENSKVMKAPKRGFNADAYWQGVASGKDASLHRPMNGGEALKQLEN